ncbi:hypothetical protein CC80DRAFT_220501 [Byssothecium circinans]|uniref:Uncharacterized protein n=1 Tax=Byssothecium circinans TaxID=147558 RepID=A0A6A5TF50_9PLEO|nr:hypothetical protein CC80DRAFT_220501 [Byssothecium circinans]
MVFHSSSMYMSRPRYHCLPVTPQQSYKRKSLGTLNFVIMIDAIEDKDAGIFTRSSVSDALKGMLCVGGFFFFPLAFLWSSWRVVTCLFLIAAVTVTVELLEDWLYAKSRRGRIAELEEELNKRVLHAEYKNGSLQTSQSTSSGPGRDGMRNGLTTLETLKSNRKDSRASLSGISLGSTTDVDSPTEQHSPAPESPRINLELSLSHAHKHIDVLQSANKHLNADLEASKRRVVSLEEGKLHLRQRLDRTQSFAANITRVVDELNAEPTSASGDKSERKRPAESVPRSCDVKHEAALHRSGLEASSPASREAEQYEFLGHLIAEEVRQLPRGASGRWDSTHSTKEKPPKRRPSAASGEYEGTSMESDILAAERELLVKRRITAAIDLAFNVSRKRGYFEDYARPWREDGGNEGGRGDRDRYVVVKCVY